MWSLNTNKYFAGILIAIWVVWGANFAGNLIMPHADAPAHGTAVASTTATSAPSQPAEPVQPLPVLLASADVGKGARVAKKCVSCHTFDKGGKNKVGPNLYNMFTRTRGGGEGFKYSGAMAEMGGKWSFADMDKFITKPKDFLPKTKMAFVGIKKATDRAALLAYLRKYNDTPPAMPAP